jgi:hypothetical protein
MRTLHNILIVIFLLCCLSHSYGQDRQRQKAAAYFQEIKTDIPLPVGADKNVIKLFNSPNGRIAVTSNGVFRYQNGQWFGKLFGHNWRTATQNSKGEIWLASDRSIKKEGDELLIKLPASAQNDTIQCLLWEDNKILLIGTTNGLIRYDGEFTFLPNAVGKQVNSILKDTKGDLWLATNKGLLRRISGKWINMDDYLMANGLQRAYFSLDEGKEPGDVIFGGRFLIGCIAVNGDHWIKSGADGLPYGPATTIKQSGGQLWLGSDRGAIKKDSTWHYYNGKRWLPNNKVNDILPIDKYTTWIATPDGISQVQEVEMTLEQKASLFEERIQKRHNRYGIVSNSRLLTPGDLSTNQLVNDDNDGLWTSVYLASQCFRYAVTKDLEAKKNAIKSFEALERLETVTGISGFPARSFVSANDSITKSGSPYPRKWHLSADGKWKWLGATSSDEIVGHLFAIPLFLELVADGETINRAKDLIHRIINHIIDNNFHLVDLDGKPTKWGVWTPDSLNGSYDRWYERGLNSLQILSFLKTAYHFTKDPKIENAYQKLVQQHHYAENTREVKYYGPFENSHSDDILAYLPYYCLFRYSAVDQYFPIYTKSLSRTWATARQDHVPLWNIITSASLNKDCDLTLAEKELQQVPMDMIDWKMENSHRWDLPKEQMVGRFNEVQSVQPVPTPEAGITKNNRNPHQLDAGSDGSEEDDGAYFLLPYWMGRYHGFIKQ